MFAVLALSVVGCARNSYRIRQAYDRGRYDTAVGRCQMDSTAASERWNAGHRARYHVYCGMAYLGLGDGQHAAVELVQAERMRQQDPRLITGRDLERLSQGLVQLFGVPAGQLSIEERRSAVSMSAAPGGMSEEPAAPVTIVPPAPTPSDAPTVTISDSPDVAAPMPDPPATPDPASPPVIVIPDEDGAVIE